MLTIPDAPALANARKTLQGATLDSFSLCLGLHALDLKVVFNQIAQIEIKAFTEQIRANAIHCTNWQELEAYKQMMRDDVQGVTAMEEEIK